MFFWRSEDSLNEPLLFYLGFQAPAVDLGKRFLQTFEYIKIGANSIDTAGVKLRRLCVFRLSRLRVNDLANILHKIALFIPYPTV